MSSAQQLTFPELDFEGRTVVTVPEIALKWRCSERHVRNLFGDPQELVESGTLAVLDIRAPGASLPCRRVPMGAYRTFVAARLSGVAREELLRLLPVAELRELVADAQAVLRRKTA